MRMINYNYGTVDFNEGQFFKGSEFKIKKVFVVMTLIKFMY